MRFTVILAPEVEGGYSVICPAIPGCVSQGDSLEEALANIREAILLCLEVRKEEGLSRPVSRFLQGPQTDPGTVAELRNALAEQRSIALDILNYKAESVAPSQIA
jgi:predicted RNase H-like HicB family nuclease